MRHLLIFTFVFCSLCNKAQVKPSIHSFTAETISEEKISLSNYYGKKIMLVNTASFCQYTPQFAELEQLYRAYKQYGFEIIGFPCNDFGAQDPHSDSIIHVFCSSNYSVSFQMMSKISISSGDTSAIYKWLQRANLNGQQNVSVDWNFNKFLINESGNWVKHISSQIHPTDTSIVKWIISPSSITTSIKAFNKNNFVELTSANPINNRIELKMASESTQPYSISLHSIDGKLVASIFDGRADEQEKVSYDTGHLTGGIYFLTIENGLDKKKLKIVLTN